MKGIMIVLLAGLLITTCAVRDTDIGVAAVESIMDTAQREAREAHKELIRRLNELNIKEK